MSASPRLDGACVVCGMRRREEVERALQEMGSRAVTRRFGVGRSSLNRHRSHMSLPAGESRAAWLWARLEAIRRRMDGVVRRAESSPLLLIPAATLRELWAVEAELLRELEAVAARRQESCPHCGREEASGS